MTEISSSTYLFQQDPVGWDGFTYGGGATIDIATVFSAPSNTTQILILNGGYHDVIANNTQAQVTMEYEDSVNATSFKVVAGSNPDTDLIEDQNGTVDYTVTHNANGSYSVHDHGGALRGTLTGVPTLNFIADSSSMVTDQLFTTMKVFSKGSLYAIPSQSYLENPTQDTVVITTASRGAVIDVSDALNSQGVGASDHATVVNNTGGADTIINDTGLPGEAEMTYNESLGTFPTSLQLVQSSNAAVSYVEDQNGNIDYTLTSLGNGTFSVQGANGQSLGTVTGVRTLYFEVDGSAETVPAHLFVNLNSPSITTDNQGNYILNALNLGTTLDAGTVLAGQSTVNTVTIQNMGVNNIVTNTTSATVSVVYTETVANSHPLVPNATSLTAVAGATAGILLIEDQTGQVDYSLTTNADGSYSVVGIGVNGFGHKMGTIVSGVHDLQFEAGSASIDISLVGVPHVAAVAPSL